MIMYPPGRVQAGIETMEGGFHRRYWQSDEVTAALWDYCGDPRVLG